MSHQDYKELIPARALSALDTEDDRVLTDHLATCSECRQELDEWNATCASLAFGVELQEPSPQLRERILSSVRSSPMENRPDRSRPAEVLPFIAPRKNIWSSLGSFGSIAAALILIALLASLLILWQQNRATQKQLLALSAQLAQEQRIVQHFMTPGNAMTELVPTREAPGAKAMVAYDSKGHAMLMTRGLPAPPTGKAYQLWYIVGDKPLPGGMLSMDSEGNGMLEDQMPAAAMKAVVFAVTLEPATGVNAPTGAVLLHSGS